MRSTKCGAGSTPACVRPIYINIYKYFWRTPLTRG
nr:MAG TPA: hypothetical protein [Caudoviricetes sp.]